MTRRLAACTALALAGLLAGCATPAGTTPTPAPTPTTSAGPAATTMPGIALTRTGGFAGFNQTVTVTAAGAWTFTDQRAGTVRTGQLSDAELQRLIPLINDPRLGPEIAQVATHTCNDGIGYTLTAGAARASFTDCGEDRPAASALADFLFTATQE